MAFQSSSCSLLLSKQPLPSLRDGRGLPPVGVRAVGLKTRMQMFRVLASTGNKGSLPNSNYVVPMDNKFSSSHSSVITRPLVEILRDLNKRVPDNIINPRRSDERSSPSTLIPWYHANRMMSFFAPGLRISAVCLLANPPELKIKLHQAIGWCGEVRDVIYSDIGVTVVYRLIIRGSDGEAHRESTGTVILCDEQFTDPVTAAEEIAFCRACARFGLGLYLYHEE